MLGRSRILLEPRLAGALVVGPGRGGASPLPGTLIPWAQVLLAAHPPIPTVLDEHGNPSRAAWPRPSMHPIARRAAARSLRRELAAGTLRRTFTTPTNTDARAVLTLVFLLMAVCLVDVALTMLGRGLIIRLPPAPTMVDRLIAAVPPAMYTVLLGIASAIMVPPAAARRGTVTLTPDAITLAERSGRTTAWRWAHLAAARASVVLTLRPRVGPAVWIALPPGAAMLLRSLSDHHIPDQARREDRALRRTLFRAGVLWVVGCAAAAGVTVMVGGGGAAAAKALAASALLPAVGALKVYGEPALRNLLTAAAERRARRAARRGRTLARATGHGNPPA